MQPEPPSAAHPWHFAIVREPSGGFNRFWFGSKPARSDVWRFGSETTSFINAVESVEKTQLEFDFSLRVDVPDELFDPATFDPDASRRRKLRIVCRDRDGLWRSVGIDRDGAHRGTVGPQ